MKYHLAIKRNELLIHATTWIKLKIIIIHERNSTKQYILDNSTYTMAVWGGLTNSCEKKRSENQRSKGKI